MNESHNEFINHFAWSLITVMLKDGTSRRIQKEKES